MTLVMPVTIPVSALTNLNTQPNNNLLDFLKTKNKTTLLPVDLFNSRSKHTVFD
jgi:hypothetical protein